MRRVEPYQLWIGNPGDFRDPAVLEANGIRAVVDLALSERPLSLSREVIYLRVPLTDGGGNSPGVISVAINALASLLDAGIPTLTMCGAGMSRSPSIAAAALSRVHGGAPGERLRQVTAGAPADVSPLLWAECLRVLDRSLPGGALDVRRHDVRKTH